MTREPRLLAVLRGEDKPADNEECLAFIKLAYGDKQFAAAAKLWAAALEGDPQRAADLKAGHRYHAACCAALAGAGQGEDAGQLDDPERARLRRQALDWLRADLALRTKQLESGPPADRTAAQQALRHWQQDRDLAGLRDAAALAKLPAKDRTACAQLWADVAALLEAGRGEGELSR